MPKQVKHARLLTLGEERLQTLRTELARGVSTLVLADRIQKEWGMLHDISRSGLGKQLRRYREEEVDIPAQARQIVAARSPRVQRKAVEMADAMEVVHAHFELFHKIKARCNKWLDSPVGNLPSSAIREDLKLYHQVMKDIETVAMDLGLLKRVPKDVRVRVEHLVIDEQNVGQVVQALQNFLADNPGVEFREIIEGTLSEARRREARGRIAAILSAPDGIVHDVHELSMLPSSGRMDTNDDLDEIEAELLPAGRKLRRA